MRLRFLPCFLSPVLCLLTASCAKRETPAEAGLRSQTLLIGNLAEPRDLDPPLISAYTDQNIATTLFEGLTVLDEKSSRALPGVATRWEASTDGLVWTFHLRPDAGWSNGDRVTSQDFAYAFRRILTPALGAEYSYMLWPIKNAEAFNSGKLGDFSAVGIATPDDTTLRLTLERPTPYLPALAAHPTWYPVHRLTIEKFGRIDQRGTVWTRPGNLVGNGPFVLTEWTPNARITVEKNPHYWAAAVVRLNRIVFSPTENPDVEERAFRAGQLHLTYDVPSSKIPVYRQQTPGQLRLDPFLMVWYVNFNVTKPPLDNAKLRRALALAIDRQAISRSVFNNAFLPAHSFTPPGCGDYTPPARAEDDFAEARRLLAEAGYPGGRGLPVFPLQVLNNDKLPKMAEAIQAMWHRELGVNITIEPFEQKTWVQNQQTLSHTIGLLGWSADFADPITFLQLGLTGNGNNWTGWSSPTFDHLIAAAANTADERTRFDYFQQAESLWLAAAPVAPVVFSARTYLIHPAVRNWDPSPVGYHLYKKVYLAP